MIQNYNDNYNYNNNTKLQQSRCRQFGKLILD